MLLVLSAFDPRPEIAEALGVFALVLAGCGAIMADAMVGGVGLVGIAFAFGLTIAVMVYAVAHVSGAHFNPAITLGFAATGHFPWRRAPTYIAAQLAGAAAAAGVLLVLLGPIADVGATVPLAEVAVWKAAIVEALATALLAFVIVSVATDERVPDATAGLAIGLAVTIGALFAGPLTGGSMNPARTLGPALASGTWTSLWVYLIGPAVGSVAAMGTYEVLRSANYEEIVDAAPSPGEETVAVEASEAA